MASSPRMPLHYHCAVACVCLLDIRAAALLFPQHRWGGRPSICPPPPSNYPFPQRPVTHAVPSAPTRGASPRAPGCAEPVKNEPSVSAVAARATAAASASTAATWLLRPVSLLDGGVPGRCGGRQAWLPRAWVRVLARLARAYGSLAWGTWWASCLLRGCGYS
ncbi:hypothetical protein BJ546DRAFT_353556 [Cryomyces antarcticus]